MDKMGRTRNMTGSMGLYHVCLKLSELAWHVQVKKTNANSPNKGWCWRHKQKRISFETHGVGGKSPIQLYKRPRSIRSDFVIMVTELDSAAPVCYLLSNSEAKMAGQTNSDGTQFLNPKAYAKEEFREQWEKLETYSMLFR